jgi:hypothetical protein
MRKRIIHIAIIMTVILVLPLFLQSVHTFSNHHDQVEIFTTNTTRDLSVSSDSEHCLLCEFEYTNLLFAHAVMLNNSVIKFIDLVVPLISIHFASFNGTITSLRAPPSFLS